MANVHHLISSYIITNQTLSIAIIKLPSFEIFRMRGFIQTLNDTIYIGKDTAHFEDPTYMFTPDTLIFLIQLEAVEDWLIVLDIFDV
jgi:hypothetical protein